ncbi:MAG: hypothetical protein PHE54_01650, partial [Bacilli bacterium]|nr:hypothetical protein [Bacilli bacterium]
SLLLVIYFVLELSDGLMTSFQMITGKTLINRKKVDYSLFIPLSIAVVFIIIFIINFILSPLFLSKTYSQRIVINEDTNFNVDVEKVDFNALPIIDRASSIKLGDRVMGQMPELVSQFDVSDLYTQINYNNDIVRVTPLEYNDIFKYFANRDTGIQGYITVNSVTGEASLTKLDDGLRYMDSAIFSEDLNRKLRFSYPTKIFGEKSFELDNDGNPYWVVPVIKYHGIGIREEVVEVIILNPITGDSTLYSLNEVPSWVDHVYSADLIIDQVNDWGQYKNGFFNSIFGQQGVVVTTDGYNYTVMNDDVYLYTGITSAVADESNIGFILTNMRTKETNYYAVSGAEEYSAMASAEGQVQQMNYTSTFPLLINLNDKPTYFVSLKDNAGLVKMYGLVDVENYQKVTVIDSSLGINKLVQTYLADEEVSEDSLISKNITIKTITSAIIDSNTYYYITDTNDNKYRISIEIDEDIIPFLKVNDQITIGYLTEETVTNIKTIKHL